MDIIKQILLLMLGVSLCNAMYMKGNTYLVTDGGPLVMPVEMPIPFLKSPSFNSGGGGGGGGGGDEGGYHGGGVYGKMALLTEGGPFIVQANDVVWGHRGHGYY